VSHDSEIEALRRRFEASGRWIDRLRLYRALERIGERPFEAYLEGLAKGCVTIPSCFLITDEGVLPVEDPRVWALRKLMFIMREGYGVPVPTARS